MPSGMDYLRLSQGNAAGGIQQFSLGNVYEIGQQGEQLEAAQQKRRTLADIGLGYQAGGIEGAKDAAFRGGDVGTGLQLDQNQRAQIKEHLATLTDLAGKAEQARAPGQWDATLQQYERMGIKIPDAYRGEQGRVLAQTHAVDTMEKIKRELVQAQTQGTQASTDLHRAQTQAAGQKNALDEAIAAVVRGALPGNAQQGATTTAPVSPGNQPIPPTGGPRLQRMGDEAPPERAPNLIDAQTGRPQQQQGPQPTADMVDTPFGRMERQRATQLGGALAIAGKGDAGRMLTDAAGKEQLSKKARGEIDEKEINTSEFVARLNGIGAKFDPKYQQIENRIGYKWAEWMDSFKSGRASLTPEQRQDLAGFARFKQESLANLNQYIKEITGAAMTDAEARRIVAALPNPGQGVFDGDSPTVFQAKLQNALANAKMAVARYRHLRTNGFTGPIDQAGVTLEQMPGIINQRGAIIEQNLRQQNPNADARTIQIETEARLAREFGFAI
jgi:hypothetical protein